MFNKLKRVDTSVSVGDRMQNAKASFMEKIKAIGFAGLLILVIGAIGQFLLPWWIIAIVCVGVGFFVPAPNNALAYGTGMAAVSLLWWIMAMYMNGQNGGILSEKMGALFSVGGTQLLYISTFLGGIVGGFSMMTGTMIRQLFAHETV